MKLKLRPGDKIFHGDKEFIVSKQSSLNVRAALIGQIEQEVAGNHQTDVPDPVDRSKVVDLIKEYISKVEEHQSELVRAEAFRDDELEIGEHYRTSIYAASAVYVTELSNLVEQLGEL